jgi:hypothetical protein
MPVIQFPGCLYASRLSAVPAIFFVLWESLFYNEFADNNGLLMPGYSQ